METTTLSPGPTPWKQLSTKPQGEKKGSENVQAKFQIFLGVAVSLPYYQHAEKAADSGPKARAGPRQARGRVNLGKEQHPPFDEAPGGEVPPLILRED